MKKQYITPLCETVKGEAQTIMAGSPGISGEYSDPNLPALSKGSSLLEDDLGEEE